MENDMQTNSMHRNDLPPYQTGVRAFHEREYSGGVLRQWLGSAYRSWQRHKMIAALEALDSRLLEDIGIHRGEIPRVVERFDTRELAMVPLAPPPSPDEIEYEAYQRAA
ncbi:MAG: DUF1127 domain-containing protein [Maritimibacter sp.]|nr:DUF1127 domain-containing protein [Maritimibacter sp.]